MVAGTTNDAGAEPNQFMFFYQSEKRGQERRGSKPSEAPGWKFMSTTEGITQWAANIEWMAFFPAFFPLTKMNTLENKT